MNFNERVAAWLTSQGYGPGPFEDLKVDPHGTDWAGGAESGFYSTFDVSVRWKGGYFNVEGEGMASMWKAVVTDA